MDDIGSLEARWAQGFTTKSVAFVDSKTVCYASGNHVCFLNLETKVQSVLQGPSRGIGALTASGKDGIFAFSEERLSPSIFVYSYPELELKNELKGTAQLNYISLALSDGGPFLGSCSALPDHTITVWNWQSAEPICTQLQAGRDVISLVFNPMNWLQLCALGSKSLTVWNIEKFGHFHFLKPSIIDLPATDGSFVERSSLHSVSSELHLSSLISGQKGDMAKTILSKLFPKPRVTLTAICWTSTSKLYVGCEEGFLLLVDPDSLSVQVIFNPTAIDAIPELRQSSFQGLTIDEQGLIAAGKDGLVHCLQITDAQINVTQTWKLEGAATTVMFSPDDETLLLFSDTGRLYTVNSAQSDKVVKVLDVLSGSFVAAALSHTDRDIFVSVRASGDLQMWSPDGICLGALALKTEVTSLACCPVARYAAVGTASGDVLFIDLNGEQQPRLVHQVSLYQTSVSHLVFDQEGHYLFTGASDSHLYVLDAKPSKRFSVIGYTVLSGPVLSLSTQCTRDCEQVKLLALSAGQECKKDCGNLLTVLSLPTRDNAGPDCVDQNGRLSGLVLRVSRYKVPHPLHSCVLGVSEVFACCYKRNTLQRFQLPQETDAVSSQEVVQLEAAQEVKGHALGPASLVLSPHRLWLASVGRDGRLALRETASMERCIKMQCHSWRWGGAGRVLFSADGRTLLTTGHGDGSLVCSDLRVKDVDSVKVNEATQHSKSMDLFLRNIFSEENAVLLALPEWGREPPDAPEKTEESEVSVGPETVDVTEQDESYGNASSAPLSHPTWLESRQEAVIKEEAEQYSETKKDLRKTIKQLRDEIQEMVNENETVPEIERLDLREFNVNAEEQRRLDAMVDEEVMRVRSEIEEEILEKRYLCDVLKREFWDCMKVKGKSIKAFYSDREVKNYPLKERTDQELQNLRRVENTRKLENAAHAQQQSRLKKSYDMAGVKEEEAEAEGREADSPSLTGSFSARLGCSNPYLYDQFSLLTTEQRINQIILLQDVIYRIKTTFNADFDATHRQKVQEVNRVRERNRQIRRIMLELGLSETLWEPGLLDSEQPERVFTVDDSEIKAEKYLTPEQKKEKERKELEEQRRLAAKGSNVIDRALVDMMAGVLEVKKEDILKMEIPLPEFVLTKSSVHWSEEDKKAYKDYEKKAQELSEEKEKYKKLMEVEMKKLQESIKDATERFDETLARLFEKKVRYEMAICQEELKITYLNYSVLVEEEMMAQERELKLQLEKAVSQKEETEEEVRRCKEEIEQFHDTYDSLLAEDKILDKDFRKEFVDVPRYVVNQLYKQFKRRPWLPKVRAQTDNSSSLSDSSKMLKAMDELDDPFYMPDELNPLIWKRLCQYRRTKVESEQQIQVRALSLAEMKAFVHKRKDECKAVQQEIKSLSDKLESLHKERNHFLMNIMVQVILKQGQVEVGTTDLGPDYTNAVLIHRSVVEELNSTIMAVGEQKIPYMLKCKDLRKDINLQLWEHRKTKMQLEDTSNKLRTIQKLRLTEEQRDHLMNDRESGSKHVTMLEKTMAFQEKAHQQKVQRRKKRLAQLRRQVEKKALRNAAMEQDLPGMQVAVAERRHIHEAAALEENEAARREERYQEILLRRKLEVQARAQSEELLGLQVERQRLMLRNFPSL